MKTKEEVIKEAYGRFYDECKPNENGWTEWTNTARFSDLQFDPKRNKMRPLSLNGIETNNGWTVILSEADLPSEKIDCHFFTKEDNEYIGKYHPITLEFRTANLCYGLDFVTHYAPIEKKQPPIF